ncbi:MAG: hypothetical protein V7L31_24355 [Nostoc sp.]
MLILFLKNFSGGELLQQVIAVMLGDRFWNCRTLVILNTKVDIPNLTA